MKECLVYHNSGFCIFLNSNMVKEEDFGVTKLNTIRYNMKIMEFGERYTREKKERKKGQEFHSSIADFLQKWSVFSLNVKLHFLQN